MLVRDSRTSSAKGAVGRHERQDSAGMRLGVTVPIERAQIDRVRGSAGRTPHPQKPIASGDGGADGRREQHRHALRLPIVPGSD
jgi:hypothetical protein